MKAATMKAATMIHLLTHAEGLAEEFLTRAAATVEGLRGTKPDDPAEAKAKADDADAIATALDVARARAVPATVEAEGDGETAKASAKR